MTQVVYVNEYQPSCASLRLNDPIYTQSLDCEQIRVGLEHAPLIALLIIGAIFFVVTK